MASCPESNAQSTAFAAAGAVGERAGGDAGGWNTGGGAAEGVWETVREPHPHAAPKQAITQSQAMIELIDFILPNGRHCSGLIPGPLFCLSLILPQMR